MALPEYDLELRQKMIAKKDNHCPFGCTDDMLDDLGYCDHLIGFTNDGKMFEPLESLLVASKNGEAVIDSGQRMVNGACVQFRKGQVRGKMLYQVKESPQTPWKTVKEEEYRKTHQEESAVRTVDAKTDKVVNPEYDQTVNGITHKAKKWVSARVYRNAPVMEKETLKAG